MECQIQIKEYSGYSDASGNVIIDVRRAKPSMKPKANVIWQVVQRIALLLVIAPLTVSTTQAPKDRIHRPSERAGYSQPIQNEWVRTSQYVAVRDGTKLAVDIFRPAQNGQPVSHPLPIVWSHNRYHRAQISNGQLKTILDSESWLKTLLQHEYIVAVADVRGSGASYGTRTAEYSLQDARDAYDLTEWFAQQPWCDGNVGMYGASFMGQVQIMAASLAPPHLKAIVPQVAPFDLYSEKYPGGMFMDQSVAEWSRTVRNLDTGSLAAPVDEDRDGAMLAQAVAQHQANQDFYQLAASLPYRDSVASILEEKTSSRPWLEWGASNHLAAISRSGVAIYHMAGWYDYYRRGALISFNNLQLLSSGKDLREKILIGPWTHSRYGEYYDLAAEYLRWYDYWLKGINNGIMSEPPIRYYTLGVPENKAWRSAWQWPLSNEQPTPYYFHAGPSKSTQSANDGVLDARPPGDSTGQDNYTIDYSATTLEGTAWNDQKGLTYTTPPLPTDVEVTGHPVVHLWITSTAGDGDWFVYLEEVSENGVSQYVTDGVLRASHRALSAPAFDIMGLPYHSSFSQDVADLPSGEPVELVFDLLPTSNVFDRQHRIRVTVTGADQGNAPTPALISPPTVSLHRNSGYASHIVLPIIPTPPGETASPTPTRGTTWLLAASLLTALAIAAVLGALFVKKPFRAKPKRQ